MRFRLRAGLVKKFIRTRVELTKLPIKKPQLTRGIPQPFRYSFGRPALLSTSDDLTGTPSPPMFGVRERWRESRETSFNPSRKLLEIHEYCYRGVAGQGQDDQ